MKILPEDPRLTAYALGEIEDEFERAEIEAAVAADPELTSIVEATRALARELGEGLAAEPIPELSEFTRARLEQRPVPRPRIVAFWVEHKRSLLSAAAALALLGVLIPQFQFHQEQLSQDDALTGGRDNGSAVPLSATVEEVKEDGLAANVTVATAPVRNEPVAESRPQIPVSSEPGRAQKAAKVADIAVDAFAAPATRQRNLGAAYGNERMLMEPQLFFDPSLSLRQEAVSGWNTERYDVIEETGFRSPRVAPLSTFSIDVDTASYANVRRFLNQGQLPPADAVRIEELINYFPYSDAPPVRSLEAGGDPFAVHMAQTTAPWAPDHRLVRIALKGYEMPWAERPASNLVFLLDVSGSMNQANKLPLLKDALNLLVGRLDARDRVAIVVYAGASGLVLPPTTANNHATIQHALNNLQAGGSTNAGAGIELAYKVAREHFIAGGNNRVILCTDGDFNVGQTHRGELSEIAEAQAAAGISLTVLGFGMGNYKDDMLETLSNKGKGSYAYIDSQAEARKVFIQDLASNLFKIAKDVKIQVEFNPQVVSAYRLIGYENRRLQAEDFNDDAKKAGDIGPGHSVVALYEVIPVGSRAVLPTVDPLKYQSSGLADTGTGELATVKLRYKRPDAEVSQLIERTLAADALVAFDQADADLRFSAAVAGFGLLLRQSEGTGGFGYRELEPIVLAALGDDPGGHRSELSVLVRKAEALAAPGSHRSNDCGDQPE